MNHRHNHKPLELAHRVKGHIFENGTFHSMRRAPLPLRLPLSLSTAELSLACTPFQSETCAKTPEP